MPLHARECISFLTSLSYEMEIFSAFIANHSFAARLLLHVSCGLLNVGKFKLYGDMNKVRRNFGRRQALLTLGMLGVLYPACADAAERPVARQDLLGIARQFVDKIGGTLKSTDTMLAEKIDAEDVRMQGYFDALPDGEIMILDIQLRTPIAREYKKLTLEQPVTAIKEGRGAMLSFLDFTAAANFPIRIDPETGTAEGWFIREKNTFSLDIAGKKLIIRGAEVPLADDDVRIENNDVLVRGKALAKWFGFKMTVNPRAQRISIITPEKWPIQEKIDRVKRASGKRDKPKPQQPFVESKYQKITPPNLDVGLRESYKKIQDRPSILTTSYSVQSSSDLLGHLATASIGGSDEQLVDNITLNFSKKSENPDLLGPLKARMYEFNDVRTVAVPLAGTSPVERGFHATNKDPFSTLDTQTMLEGFATPGWDVEIYRGQQYIAAMTVDESGRYMFDNVPLFAGDNRFRIIQYGPQGEYREEEKIVTVTPGLKTDGKGLYDVSVTQQNEKTYSAQKSGDEDAGSPHISGTYEFQTDSGLVLRTGLRTRQQSGVQSSYLHTGTVSVLDNTIINTDSVLSSEGKMKSAVTARRNFGKHSGIATAVFDQAGYVTDSAPNVNAPGVLSLRGQMRGPVAFMLPNDKLLGTYDVYAGIFTRDNGTNGINGGLTVASRLFDLGVSHSLFYQQESGTFSDVQNLEGVLSVRGRALGASWRTDFGYDVLPTIAFTDLDFNVRKALGQALDADMTLERDFERSFTSADFALSWRGEYATVSPSLTYDSDQTLTARLNVRFGLAYDPYSNDIIIKNRGLSDRGRVSAFVFLDKDGDGFFNGDDTPLPDAIVEATQVNKNATSDAKGEAFIFDLPADRITDVVVQESSTFEPNWISGFSGISIRPRQGLLTRIEFPIHRGAEIDGTAYIEDEDGKRVEGRNIELIVYRPDGKIMERVETAYDGFYLITRLPPGVYYMASGSSMSPVKAYMPAQKITVTPEGGMFYGRTLTLYKGYDIEYTFRSTNEIPIKQNRSRVLKPDDIFAQETHIKLGQYRSRLAMALSWYKFKLRNKPWGDFFTLATPLADVKPDEKTALMTLDLRPKSPLTLDQAGTICQNLIDQNFPCSVELVTTFRDLANTPEVTEKTEESEKVSEKL